MLSREQWEAIESDLLRAGFTLEDCGERVSWRAIVAFAKHAGPDSALFRVTNGKEGVWSLEAHLMALIVDVLNVANFQRGGGKGQRPKPIQRPGTKPETTDWGNDAVDTASFDEFWVTRRAVE